MKCNSIFVFIFIVLTSAKEEVKSFHDSRRIDMVHSVLESLQFEAWREDETACFTDTKAILNGVKNNTLWATWVWDSIQLPVGTLYGNVYHFGNFDQCLQVPWSSHPGLQTQYCLVDVKLTALNEYDGELVDPYDDADRYIGAKFRHGKRLHTIFLGVCLPASCRPASVARISRAILSSTHLPLQDVAVHPRDCQVAGAVDKPMGFYVFWFIVLAMASICILIYLFRNTQENNSTVSRILRCFCLTRNFDALTEVREDEIKVMHGIRAFTCGTIVAAHYFYMTQFVALINKTSAEKTLSSHPLTKFILHLDLTVDTFFVMSGLLYARGLITSKSYQPLRTLVKRYIRLLLPLYALSIVCITYVLPHIGSGPAWPRLVTAEPCARSWWRNFLMISNMVDKESCCSETSWYIHCDFQLTILGTVLFMLYHKSKRTGFILCGLAYVTSIVVPTIWNYWQELPGILLYDFGESYNMVTNKVYNTVYMPVYTRASAYLIGVAMGYFMSVYKPQYHRKTISKTVSILGLIIGMSLMLGTLHIGTKLFSKEYSALSLAFLAAFDKTIWSVGICIIMSVCEYGTLPVVNDLLSSKVFVPLSKLSYSNYLFHMMFIYREIFSLRTPATYDTIRMMTHGLGYVVISYSASYLVWLFIEAPVTNLINLTFDFNRNTDTQKSATRLHNGVNTTNKKIL